MQDRFMLSAVRGLFKSRSEPSFTICGNIGWMIFGDSFA
jgi:hypothetical protein